MLFMATFLRASFLRRAHSTTLPAPIRRLTAQGYPNPQSPVLSFICPRRKLQRKGTTPAPLLLPPLSRTHRTAARCPSGASHFERDAPIQPGLIFARSYGRPRTPVPATPPPSNPQTARRSYPISTAAKPPPQWLRQTPPPMPKSSALST